MNSQAQPSRISVIPSQGPRSTVRSGFPCKRQIVDKLSIEDVVVTIVSMTPATRALKKALAYLNSKKKTANAEIIESLAGSMREQWQ